MVLHLLGKKSWNVYNSENVERVRRDEAEAQAREEAEEQAMQEADAARRIALLRGEAPPALDPPQHVNADAEGSPAERKRRSLDHGLARKRRRLRGEDDTDRDIRYAREDAAAGERAKEVLLTKDNASDAPLIDHAGHIQLLPAPDENAIRKAEKNAEAEAEKAKKRKREEDQYTMRFSNAAGFNNGMARPWYAASESKASSDNTDKALVLPHVQDKNAWGNEDPLRKERERNRISSSDPFAAMQQAQRQLKQSERDKERWQKERLAVTEELKRAEDRKRRHEKRRHRRREDEESLEDFSLDASTKEHKKDRHSDRHHRHRRRHRIRSRSRSRDRPQRSKD
jgi:hypothetical protein